MIRVKALKINKTFQQSHLLYWLSKITDVCSGKIDELDMEKQTLPEVLASIQSKPRIMDIEVAKKHTRKVREYIDGLDKQLNQLERNIRNG